MSVIVASHSLDATFSALADPTRRAILAKLAERDLTVNELTAEFDMTQPAISRHLKVLEKAGLIAGSREAQRRPRHLMPEPLAEATAYLENYRRFWEERFERLDSLLEEMKMLQKTEKASKKKRPMR